MYFLEQTASWLLKNFGENLNNISVVFPNKRSGVFFRNYLINQISKPVWSPEITDIESFILQNTAFLKADPISQVFTLYKVYSAILVQNGQNPESIDSFYPWGNIMLNDFSEIDKNLAEPADVFRLIEDLKDIDTLFDYLSPEQIEILKTFWTNINIESHTNEKARFLRMWQMLPDIYEELKKKQLKEKAAYSGFIYRILAGKCINKEWMPQEDMIVFAGFHLLNKAETTIFNYLKTEGKAVFLWDADNYFLERKEFSPYQAIRRNMSEFPEPPDFVHDRSPLTGKSFRMFGFDLTSTQVDMAAQILRVIGDNEENSPGKPDTAIVLADEKLLIPLLHTVPESMDHVNITMGYPVISSYPADIVLLLADFMIRYSGCQKVRTSDLVNLLNHPVNKMTEPENINRQLSVLNESKLAFQDLSSIKVECTFLSFLTNALASAKNLIGKLQDFLVYYLENKEITEIEKEIFYQIYKGMNRLSEHAEKENLSDLLLKKILKEILITLKVAFSGEPLSGIQVMGILETRCLDFKNLILISMNEGLWPSVSNQPSFIPYQVRKAFYLNTPENDDVAYAYYFYRLLQRAENIWLMYSNDKEAIGFAEKSRYILQLLYDFNIELNETIVSPHITKTLRKEIIYPKSEAILKQLEPYLDENNKSRFSPSALLTYLDCKLKFFYQYILKIKEKETVQEEIDAAVFGKVLHRTMELIYSDDEIKNTVIDKPLQQRIRKDFQEKLNVALQESGFQSNSNSEIPGHNLIALEMMKRFIGIILDQDMEYAPFRIVSLEGSSKNLFFDFEIVSDGRVIRPGIIGIIDRIDLKNNVFRAVDYKTGKDSTEFKDVDSLFAAEYNKRNKAVFQLLCYCLLMKNSGKFNGIIQPSLYVVSKMSDENNQPLLKFKDENGSSVDVTDFKVVESNFASRLQELLTEIFNPEVPFSQCNEEDICRYCPYNGICMKK